MFSEKKRGNVGNFIYGKIFCAFLIKRQIGIKLQWKTKRELKIAAGWMHSGQWDAITPINITTSYWISCI